MSTMTRVAGLELLPTGSAVAILTRRTGGTCLINTITYSNRGRRIDPEDRVSRLAADVDHTVGAAVLAVLNTPRTVIEGGHNSPRRQLWCEVMEHLRLRTVPVALHTAPDTDHAAAAAELWPDLAPVDKAEATAVVMATLAALRLGWDVRATSLAGLDAVRWPGSSPEVAA